MRKAGMALIAVALVATGYVVEELSDREPTPVVDTAPARPDARPLGPLCAGPINPDSPNGCVDPRVEEMTPAQRQRLREAAKREREAAPHFGDPYVRPGHAP